MRSPDSWRTLSLKAGFCVLALVIVSSYVYRYSPYFVREQRYRAVVADIATRPGATIVFAGDSHVAALHNDQMADTAYNIAFGGDSLRECYAKLRYLLARPDNQIQTVVVSADFHMFGNGRKNSANRSFADYYFLATRGFFGLQNNLLSSIMDSFPLFNDDYLKYLRESLSQYRRHNTATIVDAVPKWEALSEAERAKEATATGQGDHAGVSHESDGMRWYEQLVALTREHGVKLVAVRMPAQAQYFSSLSPETMQAVDTELARLGAPSVYDFRYAFSDPSFFIDPDHLSERGTMAFLRLFADRTGLPVVNTRSIISNSDSPYHNEVK